MFGRIRAWWRDLHRVTTLVRAIAALEDQGITPRIAMLDVMYMTVAENVEGFDHLDADQLDADLDEAERRGLIVVVATDAGTIVSTTALADRVIGKAALFDRNHRKAPK